MIVPNFDLGQQGNLPFMGEHVYCEMPRHVFDFRRSREGFEDRGGFGEMEVWRSLVSNLDRRRVRECRKMVDGGIEILVSEKGDEGRLLEVLEGLEWEQRRKYRVTMGAEYVSTRLL